jgi:hypothetical protein
LLFPCLADRLRKAGGQSTWSVSAGCSSCSSCILDCLHFDPFCELSLAGRGFADRPPGRHGLSARHELLTERLRTGRRPSVFLGVVLEVLLAFSDCLPRPRRPSAAPREPSARSPRIVRQGLRRVAKSFAFLSFAFALGLFGICSYGW